MQCIIFTGLQASGKSSFYLEHFYKTHLRINLDMLKKRSREDILLQACIDAHQRLVIDNTNPTVEDRAKYIQRFKAHHFQIVGYYFESDLKACLQRNATRKGKEKIPKRGVETVFHKLVKPSYDEGYDLLYEVKIRENKTIITKVAK